MRILITGAAGFLGSHLVGTLLSQGHQVIGMDDFTTGAKENLERFLTNSNFNFIEHDVRESFSVDSDLILNFACPASPGHYQADPVKTIETNFLGMSNVLKLAKKTGAVVVQASTSEIYGDPAISPQIENYWGNVNPIGIRSCYDEGKRSAETLCFDYMRQHDLNVKVIRIFNTYGPNMALNDGRVVSNLIIQALKNEDITIYGDGSQTRSFCYVDDLIAAIVKIAILPERISAPVNLGNPREFTILELANLIKKVTGSSSRIVFEDLPQDDPVQRKPDITRVTKLIDWKPLVELREGIELTSNYFKVQLQK